MWMAEAVEDDPYFRINSTILLIADLFTIQYTLNYIHFTWPVYYGRNFVQYIEYLPRGLNVNKLEWVHNNFQD